MKKMIIILLLLFFFLFTELVFSKKISSFPELNRPFSILIAKDRLLITDGPVVYIHSMKDFSLLNRFGKAGEGPGEFKVFATINQGSVVLALKGDKIMVTSLGRVSFYTLNGEFVEQKNIQSLFGFGIIRPFDTRYVGLGAAGDAMKQYFTLNFYTPEFKKGQELIRIIAFEQGKNINPVSIGILPAVYSSQDHIFFLDYEGLIHQFDKHGKEVMVVNISKLDKEYSRLAVSQERKDRYIQYFLSDSRFKPQFERDKNIVKFPEIFPQIKDIRVDGGKIYAVSFLEKNQQKEMYILDSKGQIIKKMTVSLGDINPRELTPYTIKDGTLYQLVENPDTEEWELHSRKLL
jgi:hypothetical protein